MNTHSLLNQGQMSVQNRSNTKIHYRTLPDRDTTIKTHKLYNVYRTNLFTSFSVMMDK